MARFDSCAAFQHNAATSKCAKCRMFLVKNGDIIIHLILRNIFTRETCSNTKAGSCIIDSDIIGNFNLCAFASKNREHPFSGGKIRRYVVFDKNFAVDAR